MQVRLLNKLSDYAQLIRLDKPIGTLLIMWPALTAVIMAYQGHPPAIVVVIFLLGAFLARSAGCVLNDLADRKLDRYVVRTQHRPITAGRVSVIEALLLCAVLLLVVLALVLQLNWVTVAMACVAVVLAAIYPLMKRVTYFPQVVLGVAFNWGILMAYTSVGVGIPVSGLLFFAAIFLLTIAYDTFYAMADREDDIKIGIKSIALFFGKKDRLATALLQFVALILLVLVGLLTSRNIWYYLGLFAAVLFACYQHYLIRRREPQACFRAFLNNNYLLTMAFLGVVLSYL